MHDPSFLANVSKVRLSAKVQACLGNSGMRTGKVGPGFLSTVINRLVWQEPSNRCSVIHDAYLVNPFNLLHPFVALSTFSLAKIMPCIGTRHETSCVPSSSR